mgnify:CR=1 FL=1
MVGIYRYIQLNKYFCALLHYDIKNKDKMASRVIMLPFLLLLLYALYRVYDNNAFAINETGIWEVLALVCGFVTIFLYFIGNEIDWWWWRKNPPKLADGFKLLLINHVSYYKNLSVENRVEFQNRIALYFKANEFMPMGELADQDNEETGGYFDGGSSRAAASEDKPLGRIPADIMLFAASALVQLTFGMEKWLLKKTDQVVIYPNPFPTPQMPDLFHTNETFLEDKVIMFSAKQLLQYYTLGTAAYAICIHEYANAFQQNNPKIKFPDLPNDFWEQVEKISGFSKSYLHEYMNLPAMDEVYAESGEFDDVQENEYRQVQRLNPQHVGVTLFFTHTSRFKEHLPDLHSAYCRIFHQDPTVKGNPMLVVSG